MPNWTYNTLTVSGPAATLKAFQRKAARRGPAFTLGSFLPAPRALAGIHTGGCHIGHDYVNQWRTNKAGENIAMPDKELAKLRAKYNATNNYDWQCQNYGTKWDVEGSLQTVGQHLEYTFNSAWCAPLVGLCSISRLYPQLTFELRATNEGDDETMDVVIRDGIEG
jgi:hypothetical protein